MSTSSTIPTFKDTLVTVLGNRANLTGVQVTRGHPGNELESEAIIVGMARGRHEIATIEAGRQTRDETYTVEVIASVISSTGTVKAAEDRAHALIAEVEEALADDPQLGIGSTILWATTGDIEERGSGHTDTGSVAEVVLRVEVKARLT